MKTRNLLVICAMGYATSTMIVRAITGFLTKKGIKNWSVESTALNMSQDYVAHADLIVSSLDLNAAEYQVPIVNGVPLISGVGEEGVLDEILEHIRKIDNLQS